MQPLTRPGALTDRPQRQRVPTPWGTSLLSQGAPWSRGVAPLPSLPRGGPGQTMAGLCDRAPDFLSPTGNQALGPTLGSVVALNCTAWVVSGPHCPLPSVQWLKDRLPLGDGSHYDLHEDSWVKDNLSEVLVSSVLGVNLTRVEDYGAFTCSIRNVSSSSFTLWRAGPAGHVAAVLASLLVLLALLLAALLYVKCRLNVLRWYQDACGEVEMNDGKLYDAYVSYSDSPEDRKFVNFILKPHLERRRGYKLFLDDRDLLPRAEPSADLLVNLSRCRRLIVVLSDAFLGRAWCSHSFRWVRRWVGWAPSRVPLTVPPPQGGPVPAAGAHAQTHLHHLRGSEARPRAPRAPPAAPAPPPGDPAALEARLRGVRGPVFGEPLAPLHASGISLGEGRGSEVDVSDLGSRNYSARTDFYCLVSEDDV
ncbi:single Ig IL-1-related receptor isoform X3 [Mirounga angustirostris]|uniref:single Ig IL-1-related receptor isoform X3 n=1 Tax=Mirounga angustirostris TaxID=9716 RepID=UPI00313BDCB7